MNGGRRRSMLGTRTNLGLQPVKLSIPGSHLGKSGRKNRPFSVQKSPPKQEQGVVKRLFDEPMKSDKISPAYTRLSSASVVKDKSPMKISCTNMGKNKDPEASQTLTRSFARASPRNFARRSTSETRMNSASSSDENSSLKPSSSKFNLLNSSHYSYLNTAKTLKSPKSPILWSNATKYRRPLKMEAIKSPEEPNFLSRTLNMLTSTAQKNTKNAPLNASLNTTDTNFSKLESPNLSAIKVMKPVEKTSHCSIKNLYSLNSSMNKIALNNETINEDTVMENGSDDDSFLDNETMCLMDNDKTVKNVPDLKEITVKNASTSINNTVLPTPRKLSIISEEIAVKSEPNSFKCNSSSDNEQLTNIMNCVNDLMISKEQFLSEQNNLFGQVNSFMGSIKQSQESFFSKQNEILTKVSNIVAKLSENTSEKKSPAISVNPPVNEIITGRIAGNGNDDDGDLLPEDMNDANNSLICATKKLKIFDEDSATPRRSLRILDKVESTKKSNDKPFRTPEKLKSKGPSSYLNSNDADDTMTEFKENDLRTPTNQKSDLKSSGSSGKFYSAKRLSRSVTKSNLRTPTCPRKSLVDKNFSKYETPSKKSKKSPLGRKSIRLTKTPNMNKNQSENDSTAALMNNLRRTCSFLKTPKNTNRMSINASNFLTPHSMSFVVQDQMKNIFSS